MLALSLHREFTDSGILLLSMITLDMPNFRLLVVMVAYFAD